MVPDKWTAVAGSWRLINKDVEDKVRASVREVLNSGGGIITGGALNVDYVAADEALKIDPTARRLKIFLPATLEIYSAHYRKRAKEGVIKQRQAEGLIIQLESVKAVNPDAIIEIAEHEEVNNDTYFDRISKIIEAADELLAFQINRSPGTQNTIDKAKRKGIPVKLFSYTIE